MKLTASEIETRLSTLPAWSRKDGAVTRQFTFGGFPDAIAFVVRLAFDAEASDHHPDLQISYKRVTVTWTTHDEGGITQKDLDGARRSDDIAFRLGAK